MTCSQFRESLDCYLDGELAAADAAAADLHRRECPACDRLAVRLLESKAAVKRTVGSAPLPADLDARVRAAIAPQWKRRVAGAALLSSRWRWAVAAGLILAAAIVGAGTMSPLDAGAANAMERLALHLDETAPVVLEGTILCRDCELEHRYGVEAPCRRTGHHGAIATADGRIWNLIEQGAGAQLINNQTLLGRRVVVHGRLYRGARTLVVERYELRG
jgi:hypothetical protein